MSFVAGGGFSDVDVIDSFVLLHGVLTGCFYNLNHLSCGTTFMRPGRVLSQFSWAPFAGVQPINIFLETEGGVLCVVLPGAFAGGCDNLRVLCHRQLLCCRGDYRSSTVETIDLKGFRMGNNLGCREHIDTWLVVKPGNELCLFVSFPPDHVRGHAVHRDRSLDSRVARIGNEAAMTTVIAQVW